MNAKNKDATKMVLTVGTGVGQYGTAQPQIRVQMAAGTTDRQLRAALHRVAADVELAMPAREGWPVEMAILSDGVGRVYLELIEGDDLEAARGVALLRRVTR